jgi:hypothetical protein
MSATPLQAILHALQVGVPFSVDLKNYMSVPATQFTAIGTSRAYNQSIWPAGISLSSDGILSGTPSEATSAVVRVRAARGAHDLEASWAARIVGAHNSERFNTNAAIAAGLATNRNYNIAHDTVIKRSGGGSLYLAYANGNVDQSFFSYSTRDPQIMTGGAGGAFASDRGYAPGEEVYLAFSARFGRNYIQYPWPQWGKIIIWDSPQWLTNLSHKYTANEQEIVLMPGHGWPHAYTNGNEGQAWYNGTWPGGVGIQPSPLNNEGDIVFQTNVKNTSRSLNGVANGMPSGGTLGGAWTSNQQQRARNGYQYGIYTNIGHPDGRPDPLGGGSPFPFDQWVHFLMYMKLATGPVQSDVDGRAWLTTGGQHKVWMAQDGQDYQLLYNNTNHPLRIGDGKTDADAPNYFWKTDHPHTLEDPSSAYSKTTCLGCVHFTNLFYALDITAGPLYEHNIAEIISGPNFIPAPGFDGTGNYRSADRLITLRIT